MLENIPTEVCVDEASAIQQMKRGDIHGLEYLVDKYQVKAVRAAYLITQDVQQAEDVVQDVFVRIFQRINQFDESKPFAP
jgi:RNA polymerase sigma-70 factor (ECF subfamily)